MHYSALSAGPPVVLLTIRNGVVDGCERYSPGSIPVSVILTADADADAARLRDALATLPHVPPLRARQKGVDTFPRP